MILQSLLVALLLFGRSVSQNGDLQNGACYTDADCNGSVLDLQPFQNTVKDCCVGTGNGRSYSYGGACTVRECIVHGFVNATYDVMEGDGLYTYFQLTITTSGLMIAGNITAMAGGTANDSDFVVFNPLWVGNTTDVHLLTYDDDITLEYDDSVILTFTPNDPDLISSLEAAGEYIRDTATVNIRDNDKLVVYFEESKYSITEGSHLSSPIRLRLKNRNQSPFNLTLRTMTIDSVEDEGLGAFIDSGNISSHSRATTGMMPNSTSESSYASGGVCEHGEVRLVNGPSVIEGRVEICLNETWGTVCNYGWSANDARVVCRQLGLDSPSALAIHGERYGMGTGPILLNEVACRGHESSLLECSYMNDYIQFCDHYEDASVECSGAIALSEMYDFTLSTITVEVPAYVVGGTYELPNDWFNVTDDNVNEIEQSFAVMAEVGADVPNDISCFQTQDRETNYHGRSGATEIRIEDNDPMVIGFRHRRMTVPESGHDYDGYHYYYYYYDYYFYNYYHDFDDAIIDVGSERTSERLYTVVFTVEENNSTATVGTEGQAFSPFDIVFGERLSSDGPIQKILELAPGEDEIRLLVEIVNDLDLESQECFTISISPTSDNGFVCNDGENATDYFCNLILCIDDDDGPIEFSFDNDTYTVNENDGRVIVCVTPNRNVRAACDGRYTYIRLVITVDMESSGGSGDSRDNYYYIINYHCSYGSSPCTYISIENDGVVEQQKDLILRLEIDYHGNLNVAIGVGEAVVFIEEDDMAVGFSSVDYTATESDGSVSVCVVHEGARTERPFSVALLPREGYDSDQYPLDCIVMLNFSVNEIKKCHNYTITDDSNCELDKMTEPAFILRLALLSTNDQTIYIHSDRSKTNIFTDDSKEPECRVMVGYNESSYTLSEAEGYVEVCVNATSPGTTAEFIINSTITENITNLYGFITNASVILNFTVNAYGVDYQCYSISADFSVDNVCDYYTNYTDDIFIKLQLARYNETDLVSLTDSFTADFIIQRPKECSMQSSTQSSTTAITSGVIAAIVLAIVTILSVGGAIGAILVYQRKTIEKMKKNEYTGGISPYEHHYYSLGERRRSELLLHLQEQLESKKMIYSKNQLQLSSTIGQGESGLVYKAYINTAVGKELVAVKTGKALFSTSDLEMLAKEVSTMLSFEHTNVMSLIGVCIDGEMPLLIMPFMSNGSVLEFVRHHKDEFMLTINATQHDIQVAGKTLLGICLQITKGMEYLSEHKFIHRDLAARNCMIAGNGVIKVADFGLTEDMYGTNYFRRTKNETGSEEKVPIRWMAPESIENDVYTEATDVWAFGVTVWEIYTCGRMPYPGIHPMGLLRELQRGQRLEKPDNAACTDDIYEVMLLCWSIDASERPKFSDLVITISGLLERDAGYLSLSHKTDCSYLSQLTRSLSWKNKSSPSATASDLPTVQEEEMVDEPKEEVVNTAVSTC